MSQSRIDLAAAVSELEQLLDSRPDPDDVIVSIHWHKDHQARVDELQAWLTAESQPEPEPTPEVPVIPSAKPEVQKLASMMGQLLTLSPLAAGNRAPAGQDNLETSKLCMQKRHDADVLGVVSEPGKSLARLSGTPC